MKHSLLSGLLALCLTYGASAQEPKEDVLGRHVYMAKHFKKSDKVVFSKFIVTFSTASSQAGPLDEEHARFGTFLQGVSPEVLQHITDSLFTGYRRVLQSLGYEVLAPSSVIDSKSLASWKLKEGSGEPWLVDLPYDLQQFGDREVAICFAHGTPDYRDSDLTRLPGKNGKFQDLSNETDAIVISAGFHVYFMDYDPHALGNSDIMPGTPMLYMASNMQTRLNTQLTFHYWTEKMKEPIMATYWLTDPLINPDQLGPLSSQNEAFNRGGLAPLENAGVANNFVLAEDEEFRNGSIELLSTFSKMAMDDWQVSIKER